MPPSDNLRKNKASPSWQESPPRKRNGPEKQIESKIDKPKRHVFLLAHFGKRRGEKSLTARNLHCRWFSSSSQKPRGKAALHHLSGGIAKTTKCLVEKQCRIVIWDCLISHTAFAHANGWRQNMTLSYIITPNAMSFFAKGEQKRVNVLHETWGMELWWQQDGTAAIKVDVPDYHLCCGSSSRPRNAPGAG